MVFEELLGLLNTCRQAARNQEMTRSRAYA